MTGILSAIGIRRGDGKRLVLGVSCALSEAEAHWRAFLASLKTRGIAIPDLVTSDAHEGLKAALRATLNATPWQRCQFHLQQNAQAHVPKLELRGPLSASGFANITRAIKFVGTNLVMAGIASVVRPADC